ncbi:MAG: AAA family ATPase [Patescibacteria group bacterium]
MAETKHQTSVLAVVNQKGGVGKTTTSINLGSFLARRKKSTVVIDLDPQANATAGVGVRVKPGMPTLYEVLLEQVDPLSALQPTGMANLNIIPSTPDLAGAPIELMDQPYREYRLRRAVKALAPHFEYILIDCPPSLGLLTVNGLAAADQLLIPVQCEYFALEGLNQLLNTVEMVRKHLNPRLQVLGAVLTMYDRRVALSRRVVREVRKTFPGHVFESVIPRNTELAEAPEVGKTIIEYDPNSRGAQAYEFLSDELLQLTDDEEEGG